MTIKASQVLLSVNLCGGYEWLFYTEFSESAEAGYDTGITCSVYPEMILK